MTRVRVTLEFYADIDVDIRSRYDLLTPEVMEQLVIAGIPVDGAEYVGLEVME